MSVSDPRLPWFIASNIADVLLGDESWQLLGFDGQPSPSALRTKDVALREQAVYRELLVYSFDVSARCLFGRISDQEGPRVLSLAIMFLICPEKNVDLSALFGFANVAELSQWLFAELSKLPAVDGEDRTALIVRRFHAALGGMTLNTVKGLADLELNGPLKRLRLSLMKYLGDSR
jgi:hypothetical protein